MTTFMLPLSLWWLFSILLIVKGNSIVEVKEILTIAGNFSLNGKFTNLAHYDISTGVWSSSNEPDLYVYGESNGKETLCQKSRLFVLLIYMLCCPGVLWDTKVNRSSHTGPNGNSVDELFVVGAFDVCHQLLTPHITPSETLLFTCACPTLSCRCSTAAWASGRVCPSTKWVRVCVRAAVAAPRACSFRPRPLGRVETCSWEVRGQEQGSRGVSASELIR
jgi:hypothetical protein